MIKIGLWLLPWFPILIVCLVVYGHFNPEFLMDDGPWPRAHPFAAHYIAPLVGLGSMAAFLIGLLLTIIATIRHFLVKPHLSA